MKRELLSNRFSSDSPQHMLEQILLIKMPDIYQIAKQPRASATHRELEKLLMLLLGIAVQGENKRSFIEHLQSEMDASVQADLVPYIQLMTSGDDLSFAMSRRLSSSACLKQQPATTVVKLQRSQSIATTHHPRCCSTLDENNEMATSTTTLVLSHLLSGSDHQQQQHQHQQAGAADHLASLDAFFQHKLVPNVQRIVDERDSYLESIIELLQDKECMRLELESCALTRAATAAAAGFSSVAPSSSSSLLDPETLVRLFESISKERAMATAAAAAASSSSSSSSSDTSQPTSSTSPLASTMSAVAAAVAEWSSQPPLGGSGISTTSQTNSNSNSSAELVQCKLRLRQLLNEMEDKSEQIESLRDEIASVRRQTSELRAENSALHERASLAAVYGDELELLRDKTARLERCECELARARQRCDELEATRARADELAADNCLLVETRSLLDKQLADYEARWLAAQRADADVAKLRMQLDECSRERDLDKRRARDLCEKNAKLELDMKSALMASAASEREMHEWREKCTFAEAELERERASAAGSLAAAEAARAHAADTWRVRVEQLERELADVERVCGEREAELAEVRKARRRDEAALDERQAECKVAGEQLLVEQEARKRTERALDECRADLRHLTCRLEEMVRREAAAVERRRDAESMTTAECSDADKEKEKEKEKEEESEDFVQLVESHEKLNASYKSLLGGHEHLQKMYMQLEGDYDELCGELAKKRDALMRVTDKLDAANDKISTYAVEIEKMSSELSALHVRATPPPPLPPQPVQKSVDATTQATVETSKSSSKAFELELEKRYEAKFAHLNDEIKQLQIKVSFLPLLHIDIDTTTSTNFQPRNR